MAVEGSVAAALPLLAATLPFGQIVASNLGTHVFPTAWIVRPMALLIVGTGVLIAILRPFAGSWASSSYAATVFLLGCPFYLSLVTGLGTAPAALRCVAAAFIVMLLVASVICGRAMRPPLPAVACLTLLVGTGWAVGRPLVQKRGASYHAVASVPGVDEHFREMLSTPTPDARPDVYYIVTDGLARPDILRSRFGVDADPAIEHLRRLGVTVTDRSRSNYAQTYLSLASSLNGVYVEPSLAATIGQDDRRPLDDLIKRGDMLARFRDLGYEFVMVASDTTITAGHPLADRCYCPLPAGPTELEYVLLAASPFGDLIQADHAAQRAHWAHVNNAFDHIEAAQSARPLLLFAHVAVPHPPFVFASDGSYRPIRPLFSIGDGEKFHGTRAEYRLGYAAQARFVLGRVESLAEHLLGRARRPVVVIHGDHGSALGMVGETEDRTDRNNWEERLAIFSAYGGPEGVSPPPRDTTPVNALRWAYSAATSTPYVPLGNRSYASTYYRPYDLVEVPAPPAR